MYVYEIFTGARYGQSSNEFENGCTTMQCGARVLHGVTSLTF